MRFHPAVVKATSAALESFYAEHRQTESEPLLTWAARVAEDEIVGGWTKDNEAPSSD